MGIFADDLDIIKVAIGLFWAILFLQSGLDKVLDWKGNASWLTSHFDKSILKGAVTPMLGMLTLVELIAGGLCLAGVVQVFLSGKTYWLSLGVITSVVALIMLFFGQRLAKDYDGAKTIAIYFGVALLSCMMLIHH